jgi:uncharacterized protein YerC
MPTPRKFNLGTLTALVDQGLTTPQIAEHLGVNKATIARHRRNLGITTVLPRMTPERRARIEQMLDDGMPFREIHRTEGADMSTLRKHFPGRQWTTEQTREHVAAVRPIYRKLRRAERMQALNRTYGNAA